MPTRRAFLQSSLAAASCLSFSRLSHWPAAAQLENTLTLLQTTDIHCQLHTHDELFWENNQLTFRKAGGYARLAALLNRFRAENPHTILVETGDMFQGSELSDKTRGEALIPILNTLHYDLITPGNWEVIFYKQQMQHLLSQLAAPKICANMYHQKPDGTRGELIFKPYQVIEKLGVKIGFLGYTDHLVPTRQPPALSKGILYAKPEENLKEMVHKLRKDEGCGFIVILSHLGLSQQLALANHPDCEGVNYIFGGDTHERIRKPLQGKYAKVVEPGAFGTFVGRLDLQVEQGNVVSERYELVEVKADYPEDRRMAKLVKAQEKPHLAHQQKIIGYSTVPLYRNFVIENTMDTLVIDALKWRTGVDIALSNGFRFCPPRYEKNRDGLIPITESYLFDMLPVNSPVRIGKIKGDKIRPWLERELENVFAREAASRFGGWLVKTRGLEFSFYAFKPLGQKLQRLTLNGQPIDPDKFYTVCACEREGDPDDVLCRLKGIQGAKSENYTLHDAMRAYIRAHSPVTPLPRGHVQVLDASPQLLSQVWGVDYQFS